MYFVIILSIFFTPWMYAKTAQELFLQAQECYGIGDYAQALTLYEHIDPKNSAIWYNMGNCAYKKNDLLSALLYWHRAAQTGTGTLAHDAFYNSNMVLQKLGIQPLEPSLVGRIPSLAFQILFFLIFSIFLLLSYPLIRRKKFITFSILGLLTGGSGLITYNAYIHATTKTGLIMLDSSALYTGPDIRYHQVTTLKAGSVITLIEEKEQWIKVVVQKQTGWMRQSAVAII